MDKPAQKQKKEGANVKKVLGDQLLKYAMLDEQAKRLAKEAAEVSAAIQLLMEQNAMKEASATGKVGEATYSVEAAFKEMEVSAVNVEKLRKEVKDEKLFLKIVSATQKNVTTFVGDLVLQRCLERTPAGIAFRLKAKKV